MSSERFDPYYTWLGIPPEEQPPHAYRLLGLAPFEANPQVIENAADRQMMHLRSMQAGVRSADSQRLLNEVATARFRLLDQGQKASYDEQLRRALAPQQQPVRPTPNPAPAQPAMTARPATAGRGRPARRSSPLSLAWIVLGGIAGIGLGLLVVSHLKQRGLLQSDQSHDPISRSTEPSGSRRNPGLVAPPASPTTGSEQTRNAASLSAESRPPASSLASPLVPAHDQSAANEAVAKVSSAPSPQIVPNPAPFAPSDSTQPPQPATAYLFAQVPSNFRLPPLISSAAAPLLRLAREPEEPLTLTVHSAAANLPAKGSIIAEADSQGRGWIVQYVGDPQEQASKVVLAIVRREGLELSLAWTAPLTDSELRRQLANCLLEIGTAKDARVMQLREPIAAGPLVLDLEKDNQVVELDVADPPPPGKLVLKIVELSGFARGGKLRGGDAVALGKTAYVDFADMKGAQVELRFVRQASKLLVRAEPVFKEGGDKEFELTIPRLDKFQAALQNSLAKAQAEIPVLQNNLSDAKSALRSLQSRQSTNIQEEAMRRPQIVSAASLVDRIAQRIVRLQKQVAESQARLSAVPEVRSFIQSLHNRATVKYLVMAPSGDKELVLVDGQSNAAGAQ